MNKKPHTQTRMFRIPKGGTKSQQQITANTADELISLIDNAIAEAASTYGMERVKALSSYKDLVSLRALLSVMAGREIITRRSNDNE